jgi:hypothetical protein
MDLDVWASMWGAPGCSTPFAPFTAVVVIWDATDMLDDDSQESLARRTFYYHMQAAPVETAFRATLHGMWWDVATNLELHSRRQMRAIEESNRTMWEQDVSTFLSKCLLRDASVFTTARL